jgi:hypothetical protein
MNAEHDGEEDMVTSAGMQDAASDIQDQDQDCITVQSTTTRNHLSSVIRDAADGQVQIDLRTPPTETFD